MKFWKRGGVQFAASIDDKTGKVKLGVDFDIPKLTANDEKTLHGVAAHLPKDILEEINRALARGKAKKK